MTVEVSVAKKQIVRPAHVLPKSLGLLRNADSYVRNGSNLPTHLSLSAWK
jgi:hypothetical protein